MDDQEQARVLSGETDATVWAREFRAQFFPGQVDRERLVGDAPDEHSIMGWFANAIEAGRHAGHFAGLRDAVERELVELVVRRFPTWAVLELHDDHAYEAVGAMLDALHEEHGIGAATRTPPASPSETANAGLESRDNWPAPIDAIIRKGLGYRPGNDARTLAEELQAALTSTYEQGRVEGEHGMNVDTAEQLLGVLEWYRRATGVDEWDEADDRTLLYSACHEVLGEAGYVKVMRETAVPLRLVTLDDVFFALELGLPNDLYAEAAEVLKREWTGYDETEADRVVLTLDEGWALRNAVMGDHIDTDAMNRAVVKIDGRAARANKEA